MIERFHAVELQANLVPELRKEASMIPSLRSDVQALRTECSELEEVRVPFLNARYFLHEDLEREKKEGRTVADMLIGKMRDGILVFRTRCFHR